MNKKYAISGVLAGLSMLIMTPIASASILSGKIQRIRINTGTSGSSRISILMTGNTSCRLNGWFAYESDNTSIGLAFANTQGLLAAYQSGRSITIQGTGTCDALGVEKISYIDLL
jgi:hypothetical protein